jgi:hypothetical protein
MSNNLNNDQLKALEFTKRWWKSNELCMVIDGEAGTGKTYLVNTILKELISARPMVLCPTHESLKQVVDKIDGNYLFKTVHSALGIAPTTSKQDLEFEHSNIPKFWEDYNLAIIDESSMIPNWILDILISIGIKLIFLGHKSQLPPVELRRKIFDKCISPVFERDFPNVTLTQQMRSIGDIYIFNKYLERMIYSNTTIIPNTFDIKKAELDTYLSSVQGKDDLLSGNTKIALWSNIGADIWNNKIRTILFGDSAKEIKYIETDKILLTAPTTVIDGLEYHSDIGLKELDYTNTGLVKLYSNTKGEVLYCEKVTVSLNPKLRILCYKLLIKFTDLVTSIYEPVNEKDRERIDIYYRNEAWNAGSKKDKIKAFKNRRFILSCFSEIKHYYAVTSHRLQGASIPNIITINSDIAKNGNMVETKKCRYVACSRAMDKLMFYRGI